jgi:hypothetical protein
MMISDITAVLVEVVASTSSTIATTLATSTLAVRILIVSAHNVLIEVDDNEPRFDFSLILP